jgi:hypothetical protein
MSKTKYCWVAVVTVCIEAALAAGERNPSALDGITQVKIIEVAAACHVTLEDVGVADGAIRLAGSSSKANDISCLMRNFAEKEIGDPVPLTITREAGVHRFVMRVNKLPTANAHVKSAFNRSNKPRP